MVQQLNTSLEHTVFILQMTDSIADSICKTIRIQRERIILIRSIGFTLDVNKVCC